MTPVLERPVCDDVEFARIVDELTRRGFLGGLAGTAALLGLAACGSGDPEASGDAAAAGFPVSVDGKFGRVTIPAKPTRVVALGQGPDSDASLALGVVPVAMPKDPSVPAGIQPWTAAKLPGAKPELLDVSSGLPFEQIVALRPDLIIATTYYGLAQDHATLSKIAPVLAYVTGPNTDSWQDCTTRVGRAVGEPARAAQLVTRVEAKIASVRDQHPEFAGKTFTFGPVQADGTIYTTNSPSDLSAALLTQLGLRLSPAAAGLPASSTRGKAIVSPERLDLLDADVLILTYISAARRAGLEGSELFQRLKAVQDGAYIDLPLSAATAMAFPSALSIEYALDIIVPELADAIG